MEEKYKPRRGRCSAEIRIKRQCGYASFGLGASQWIMIVPSIVGTRQRTKAERRLSRPVLYIHSYMPRPRPCGGVHDTILARWPQGRAHMLCSCRSRCIDVLAQFIPSQLQQRDKAPVWVVVYCTPYGLVLVSLRGRAGGRAAQLLWACFYGCRLYQAPMATLARNCTISSVSGPFRPFNELSRAPRFRHRLCRTLRQKILTDGGIDERHLVRCPHWMNYLLYLIPQCPPFCYCICRGVTWAPRTSSWTTAGLSHRHDVPKPGILWTRQVNGTFVRRRNIPNSPIIIPISSHHTSTVRKRFLPSGQSCRRPGRSSGSSPLYGLLWEPNMGRPVSYGLVFQASPLKAAACCTESCSLPRLTDDVAARGSAQCVVQNPQNRSKILLCNIPWSFSVAKRQCLSCRVRKPTTVFHD
ncbi:hypothetical protein L209DRAFT_215313 [Thermothelomyces heterothallicus CBS 203.75]